MEILFIKCKEDGQISPDEFELFQKLLKDFENEANIKAEIKSKDVKKVEIMAKKGDTAAAVEYVVQQCSPETTNN